MQVVSQEKDKRFIKILKKISVEDRGFLFADSIYELISVFNKKIIDILLN